MGAKKGPKGPFGHGSATPALDRLRMMSAKDTTARQSAEIKRWREIAAHWAKRAVAAESRLSLIDGNLIGASGFVQNPSQPWRT